MYFHVDRPTTAIKKLTADYRTMIEGRSTDYSTTASNEEIGYRCKKINNLVRQT